MTAVRLFAALVLTFGWPLSVWAQAAFPGALQFERVDVPEKTSGPIKFNVAVQLAGMLPQVERFRVYCDIGNGPVSATIMSGYSAILRLAGGGFSGTVPVWINYWSNGNLGPDAQYRCELILFPAKPDSAWIEIGPGLVDRPASDEKLDWQKRHPAAPYAGVIRGAFPPRQGEALDQLKNQQTQPQDSAAGKVIEVQQKLEQMKKELNDHLTTIEKLKR